MTLEHVGAFLAGFGAGFGAGLLFAAIAWGRHSFLTRRKWRDLPPYITEE